MAEQENIKRKLTAVMHADVKGYSRLMSDDEESTVKTLAEYRQELHRLTGEHRGRVVDTAGDGFLLEFASVVDATNCAVELQRIFRDKNLELPEDRRLQFRIGINIGDVIEHDGSLFGSGVNIAARLEGIADPGGICVSGEAYDQLKGKVDLEFVSMGSHSVKNIPEPVRVYKVCMEGTPCAPCADPSKNRASSRHLVILALSLVVTVVSIIVVMWFPGAPSKPEPVQPVAKPVSQPTATEPSESSIAVMPFDNLSGDPDQEYLGDGITEEIITNLAKIPDLFVIARNSTFTYKGKPVNISEVGKALGVRYVLEGSVKKSNDKIRVTAQLIDARTGGHVWAERFDTDFSSVFELEDEITKKIMSGLKVKLALQSSESLEIEKKLEKDPIVFDRLMRASHMMDSHGKEAIKRARKMFEQALESNPQSSRAMAGLAKTYLADLQSGGSGARKEDLDAAERHIRKSLELNPTSDTATLILSRVQVARKDLDQALETAKKALALNPNNADALAFMGRIQTFLGDPVDAIRNIQKAIRLNPMGPSWYYDSLGLAFISAEKPNDAIANFTKAREMNQRDVFANIGLIAALNLTGQATKAKNAVDDFTISHPNFSTDELRKRLPYKNPQDLERIMKALEASGMQGSR